MLHRLDSSTVTKRIQPHPLLVEGDTATALSSAAPVEGYPFPMWECETRWSNGCIMYNMFIRSCAASQLALYKPASLCWAPVRSSAQIHVGYLDLRRQCRYSRRRSWAGNSVAKIWLKYQDDSTSLWMACRATLQRIGSHSVFVGLSVPNTVLVMAFN